MEIDQVRICVPVCERSFVEFERAVERASPAAELIEFRLDYLAQTEFDQRRDQITALIRSLEGRAVVTLRPTEQGGKRELDLAARVEFWNRLDTPAALFDIER